MYNIEILKNADQFSDTYEVQLIDYKKEISKDDVKNFRRKFDLTQVALANLFGIRKKTVEKWEQGKNKITGSSVILFRLYEDDPTLMQRVISVNKVSKAKPYHEVVIPTQIISNNYDDMVEYGQYHLTDHKIVNGRIDERGLVYGWN